ncbi:MAG: tetratricopeptide repeat protein [Candidatus Omnitrophica bacterium]|nr:hypothetical protein [bacterium]NUN95660.1 tetratricopeptide repeat protein [Candidatus Omnitrophota bacterium]
MKAVTPALILAFLAVGGMAQPPTAPDTTGGDGLIIEEDSPPVMLLDTAPSPTPTPGDKSAIPEVDVTGMANTQIFRLANEAYEKEEFETAAAYYGGLVEKGVANGDVYFNLANACFRAGDFGRAVLYYEKALRLRPRDPDIAHNLEYARTFLIDKEIESDRLPGSLETILVLHRRTTTPETLWLLAVLSAALALLLLARRLHRSLRERVLLGYLQGALVTLLLLQVASAGFKLWSDKNLRDGIILENSVKAGASPGAEEELLELNAGTKVRILDIRNGYAHIRLPNGIPAFVPEESIGEV